MSSIRPARQFSHRTQSKPGSGNPTHTDTLFRSLTFGISLHDRDELRDMTPRHNELLGIGNWIVATDDHEWRPIDACGLEPTPESVLSLLGESGIEARMISDLPSCC